MSGWFLGAAMLAAGVAGGMWLAPRVARRVGGSRQGRWGAGLGLVFGIVFGFGAVGIVLGPPFGAVLGELYRDRGERRRAAEESAEDQPGSAEGRQVAKPDTAALFRAGGGSFLTFWCGTGWQILAVITLLEAF